MKGKIVIEDYKVHCIVGAHPHERKIEQEVALDIEIEADFTPCVLSDSIADTINYEKVVSVCRDLAVSRQYHLIETFAFETLHAIFSAFPTLFSVKVRVKKKGALPLASCAFIEFEKQRDEE